MDGYDPDMAFGRALHTVEIMPTVDLGKEAGRTVVAALDDVMRDIGK